MHRPCEVGRRFEKVELASQKYRVRAQVHESFASNELADHSIDVGVQQWLTAGNGHDRRTALLDGADDLLDGQPPAQDLGRMLDLAAARTFEVACEQWLDFHDERELVLDRLHRRGPAVLASEIDDVGEQFLVIVYAEAAGLNTGRDGVPELNAGIPSIQNLELRLRDGVVEHYLEQEPVLLGLGQGVRSLVLDRVLRRAPTHLR